MMNILDWLPDFLNTLSGILLIIPVIRLNSSAKLVWRLEKINFALDDHPFFEQERNRLANKLRNEGDNWNKLNERLLYFGIAALLLAFVVKLLALMGFP